ncbi:hypothetical protein M413DRAFT_59206, partial [Hebeloma cylindrosporum]
FRSSRIRMGDWDVAANDYFRNEGGRFNFLERNRIFTGPDGREYMWRLGKRRCKASLFVNDSAKTPVACLHRRGPGIVGHAPAASLEIFAAGKDIVDLIVVTGVYMERMRKDRE